MSLVGESTIEAVLAESRVGLVRVSGAELEGVLAAGGCVIDVRPEARRLADGHILGAVVIDRLVLEWRLDARSAHRWVGGPALDDVVVIVCNEGYASSLAARDVRRLGFTKATDLVGGFHAYAAAGLPVVREPSLVVA